ncbi:hypothetical protein M9458_056405 [Cirrhinus mrigala]|uniref:Reverse transcriptase domain-containing protein n=1 Tax=Cirrhinus mrigala TaxID=683832 RepID=A0ABD0MDB6_CIRMR
MKKNREEVSTAALWGWGQKLKSAKPVVKTVKRWTNETEWVLQACFELTDWSVFEAAANDLDELTETVTSYISFCEDMCIPTRTYLTYNNDKPWFTAKLRQLSQAKEDAYKYGDKVLYKQAKYTLEKEIKVAKRTYSEKLRNQLYSSDSSSVWKGLKVITNCKTPSPSTVENQQLADDLNEFYCRFKKTLLTPSTTPLSPTPALQIREGDVCRVFRKNKRRKAPGPDGVTPSCLKTCANQLAPIFSQFFNRSLELCEVPSCFKRSTIIPVPKKPKITGLKDYRPVVLTSVVMKSFEKLFGLQHYHPKPTPAKINSALRAYLHLSVDHQLLDRQAATSTINTGTPQGCVLSPLLFSLYTNECTSKDHSVKLLKFAHDTTVIGLIQDGDESAYRQEVKELAVWCSHNNLELNTLKTVEMTVDFRRNPSALPRLTIMDSTVMTVETFRFLGNTISQDLKWDNHIDAIVKKAQQRLFFLRQLRKFNLPQELLKQFYTAIIESVLCTSITVWFSSATKSDLRRLHRTVRTAERIIGTTLPTLQELYLSRVSKKAGKITLDPSHPAHSLFELLPSGQRYRAPEPARHRNSFFPQAIHLMNTSQ